MLTLNTYIVEYDKGLKEQEQQESKQEQELKEIKAETIEQLEAIKKVYNLDLTVNEMLEVSDCPVKTCLTSVEGLIKDWEYYYQDITDMTQQDWEDLEKEYLS